MRVLTPMSRITVRRRLSRSRLSSYSSKQRVGLPPNDCGREGALPKENCAALCNQPLIACELIPAVPSYSAVRRTAPSFLINCGGHNMINRVLAISTLGLLLGNAAIAADEAPPNARPPSVGIFSYSLPS